jgi:hypothetical protein
MCCCGKPTINGTLGYKWQPNDAPMTREVHPPALGADDVLIHDEPGRCGGIDSHCHHYRLVKRYSSYYLLVRHGGGDERVSLSLYGNGMKEMIAALDSNARYWLLNELYSVHSHAERRGREEEDYRWRKAAADKRIKTRSYPKRGTIKVWIEPELKQSA